MISAEEYYCNIGVLFVSVCSPGVFGVETDPVEIRELMEGDAVILDTKCVTKLQKDDEIVWKFGSDVIATIKANNPLLYDTDDARFKDKLQINDQTGDLTIRNARTTHSGSYEVKITNITHTTHRTFSVTVLGKHSFMTEQHILILNFSKCNCSVWVIQNVYFHLKC